MKKTNTVRLACAKCGRLLSDAIVRKCPHEAVNRLLGEHICIYCCQKCKFHTRQPFCSVVGCSLWRKEGNECTTSKKLKKN